MPHERNKSRDWSVVPPIKITGEKLIISLANSELNAPYSGSLLIKSIDSEKGQLICELIPNRTQPKRLKTDLSVIVSKSRLESIPHGYTYFFTNKAKSRAYGREVSDYDYYKRERDLSYLVIIKKNGNERRYHLGSLLDPKSILNEALRTLPTHNFLRSDIEISEMPTGLRHGQKIKAVLDILTKEGFLIREEIKHGEKTKDKFTRTEKTVRDLKS